jgi:hypothetical protein
MELANQLEIHTPPVEDIILNLPKRVCRFQMRFSPLKWVRSGTKESGNIWDKEENNLYL